MIARIVRTLAAVVPWLVHAVFAGLWGLNGYVEGFPFILVMAVAWTGALIAMRAITAGTRSRVARTVANVAFLTLAFLAGWEGGISVLPALGCFIVADLVDPTTPAFPIHVPRRAAVLIVGAVCIALLPVALTAPLYSSATSVAVPVGASPAPSIVTTVTLLDLMGGPVVAVAAAALTLAFAVVLRRRSHS